MDIRVAHEADAAAMARLMVDTFLAAHRDHMPADAWARRAEEWTYAASEQSWRRTLREIAAGTLRSECIYVAIDDDGDLAGLAMGGPTEPPDRPQTGEVYALYVRASHQGRGLGRRLVQAVAAYLAQEGMTSLEIACLAANAPARRFYEAIGGRVVGERLLDEGVMLPGVVYGWPDINALIMLA